MTAQNTSLSALGRAREATPGTLITVPTNYIPFFNVKDEDVIGTSQDLTMRANDTGLQGAYPGSAYSKFPFDSYAYPIELGLAFADLGFVDTASAAVSTTLSTAVAVGASVIATAATVPAGSIVLVAASGVGSAPEARYTKDAGGTLNLPLAFPHGSGAVVTVGTKHGFKLPNYPQPQPPSTSFIDFEEARTRGYAGMKCEQLDINIDGQSGDPIGISLSYQGFPGQVVSSIGTVVEPTLEPLLGWEWSALLGASAATRYLSAKYTFKRQVDPIFASDMVQGPREMFAGDLYVTCALKAIFEDTSDADTFNNYVQTNGFTSVIGSPRNGAGLVISMNKPNFAEFKPDRSGDYTTADITLNGVYNTGDNGPASLSLFNTQTTAYV